MKSKALILIALIAGLAAALTAHYYLNKLKQENAGISYQKIVVARKDIPARTVLSSEWVEEIECPAGWIPPGAITHSSEVSGMINLTPLLKGEPLLRGHLGRLQESGQGLAFKVPPGKRAVTVAVDEVSGVGGLLSPGDRVDVLGSIEIAADSSGRKEAVTVAAVQNVEVLAVGKNTESSTSENAEGKTKAGETKTVTLALTPEEARPLILLSDRGKIRLLLRSPADQEKAPLAPFRPQDFMTWPQ